MKLTRRAATLAGLGVLATGASNEEALPSGFQARVKKSQDPCEGVRARILVDAVVGDLSRG